MNTEPVELNLFLSAALAVIIAVLLVGASVLYRVLNGPYVRRLSEGNSLAEGLRGAGLSLVGLVASLIVVGIGVMAVTAVIEFIRILF